MSFKPVREIKLDDEQKIEVFVLNFSLNILLEIDDEKILEENEGLSSIPDLPFEEKFKRLLLIYLKLSQVSPAREIYQLLTNVYTFFNLAKKDKFILHDTVILMDAQNNIAMATRKESPGLRVPLQ